MVTELTRRYTKKGDLMATFVLEDLNASIEVFVFPKSMADYGALLDDDAIVVLKGRVDLRDDRLKLVCMEVQRPSWPWTGTPTCGSPCRSTRLTDRTGRRAEAPAVASIPGDSPVFLHVGEKVLRLPSEFNVDSRRGLVGELRVLLGPNAIRTLTAAGRRRSPAPDAGPNRRDGPPQSPRFGTVGGRIRQAAPNPVKSSLRLLAWRPTQPVQPMGPDGSGGIHGRPGPAVHTAGRPRSTERHMSIQVETKDCTSISDAELAEMADLCAEREPRFDIGFLSKQREEWVLVTRAREGSKLRGYSFSTLERIGGTPSLLIGLATVDRTSRADTVLRAMMGDKYRRALLAFPDEDVLVGTRLLAAEGFRAFAGLTDVVPGPGPQGHRRGAGLGPPAGQAVRGRRPHRRPDLRGGR